jgi:hypothetical protein
LQAEEAVEEEDNLVLLCFQEAVAVAVVQEVCVLQH